MPDIDASASLAGWNAHCDRAARINFGAPHPNSGDRDADDVGGVVGVRPEPHRVWARRGTPHRQRPEAGERQRVAVTKRPAAREARSLGPAAVSLCALCAAASAGPIPTAGQGEGKESDREHGVSHDARSVPRDRLNTSAKKSPSDVDFQSGPEVGCSLAARLKGEGGGLVEEFAGEISRTLGVVGAGLLCIAGASKLAAPRSAVRAVAALGLPANRLAVGALAAGELLVGAAHLAFPTAASAVAVGAIYGVFTVIATNGVRAGESGAPCGCFGSVDSRYTPFHVGFDAIVASAVAFGVARGAPVGLASPTAVSGVVFAAAAALATYLSWLLLTEFGALVALVEGSSGRRPRRPAK